MAHKTKIGGTAYEISGGRTLVDGTGYSIEKGRTKVDGTGYDISFITGTPIGSLAVGTSVYMDFDGVRTEFLIVNQGNPDSSIYHESCNGTWLLMKNICAKKKWTSSSEPYHSNDYTTSQIHKKANAFFINLLDSNIAGLIKKVRIPYTKGVGSSGSLAYGNDGLLTKAFLLSYIEIDLGVGVVSMNNEGATLQYFKSGGSTVANHEGTATYWWTRTPSINDDEKVRCVSPAGTRTTGDETSTLGVRYAFILPSEAVVDSEFNVIA